MNKKWLIIIITALVFGILIPLFGYTEMRQWYYVVMSIGVILGIILSILLYSKNPVYLLALVLPTIILGQVATLRFRDWYYEISLSEILVLLLCLYFIIDVIASRRIRTLRFPLSLVFLILYIFLAFLSLGWAPSLSRGLIALRILCFHLAILFLTLNLVKNKKDFYFALVSIPVTGLLVSIQLITKVIMLGGLFADDVVARETIITPVGKWVYIAAIIILTIPLTYALLFRVKSRALKFILGTTIVIALAACALTLGKGEILAIIIGLIYFVYKQKKERKFALVLGLIFLLILIFPLSSYGSQFGQRFFNTFTDPNTNFRITELRVAKILFGQHPFLGVGIGNLKLEYKNLLPWSVESESNNLFLQIGLELGLLGLTVLFLIIREIYRRLRNLKQNLQSWPQKIIYLGFASSLLVVFLNAMVEVTVVALYYGLVFWYLVALLYIFCALNKKNAL